MFESGFTAIYTESGKIFTSTAPNYPNASVSLCHEVGAFCEAYKLNERVVATICVHQTREGKNLVLSPCGVCQERLFLYGSTVGVGVPCPHDPTAWESKSLNEVQPYYWKNIFLDSSLIGKIACATDSQANGNPGK